MKRIIIDGAKLALLGAVCAAFTYGAFYAILTDPAFDYKPDPQQRTADAPPRWMENHGKRYAD